MSGRYWISGVQLGILKTMATNKTIEHLIDIVLDDQFIGNFKTDKDKVTSHKSRKILINKTKEVK